MSKKTSGSAPVEPRALTVAEREHLDALAHLPDDQIDCSDIPELTNDRLARMKRVKRPSPT